MLLVDTNILMYAAGAPHAHKEPSVQFLREVAREAGEADVLLHAEAGDMLIECRAMPTFPDSSIALVSKA